MDAYMTSMYRIILTLVYKYPHRMCKIGLYVYYSCAAYGILYTKAQDTSFLDTRKVK